MGLTGLHVAVLHLTFVSLVCSASLSCDGQGADRAESLLVLGDSYAAASAPYLTQIAQSVSCDAPFINVTRNGWTARQILDSKESWLPALKKAPAPVVIYVTAGFNDMLAPGHEKSPAAAAAVVNELLDFLNTTIAASGGRIVQVGYDDIWSLPDHPVYFSGKQYALRRELSAMFVELHTGFGLAPRNEAETEGAKRYRFVDTRGWLGDALWTNDGIHMLHANYEAQAQLLWNDEFHQLLGCEPLILDASTW
jgi:hypothetical protein